MSQNTRTRDPVLIIKPTGHGEWEVFLELTSGWSEADKRPSKRRIKLPNGRGKYQFPNRRGADIVATWYADSLRIWYVLSNSISIHEEDPE